MRTPEVPPGPVRGANYATNQALGENSGTAAGFQVCWIVSSTYDRFRRVLLRLTGCCAQCVLLFHPEGPPGPPPGANYSTNQTLGANLVDLAASKLCRGGSSTHKIDSEGCSSGLLGGMTNAYVHVPSGEPSGQP